MTEECYGSCEKHTGKIQYVNVKDPQSGFDWGEFYYCEQAIKCDTEEGLIVTILNDDEMQTPKESVLNNEKAQKIVDATMELTLRPKTGDRAKVIAAAFSELNDILDEESRTKLKKIIDELNTLSSQGELKNE